MTAPVDDWIANSDANNMVAISMTSYDINTLENVELQYTTLGSNSWVTIPVISDTELAPSTTTAIWDISEVPDGVYSVRLKLNCTGASIFTSRVSGIIDRQGPQVFGLPSPLDDIYDQSANDEIGVAYEEDIVCTNATVLLIDIETAEVIPANLSCADNEAQVVPIPILDQRGPAAYRVTLGAVADEYGNTEEDYRWLFVVGDYIYEPDCSPVDISNNNVNQDAISQSVYYSQEINTGGTVATATTIEFVAEQAVNAAPGFEVSSGGAFVANIADCPND